MAPIVGRLLTDIANNLDSDSTFSSNTSTEDSSSDDSMEDSVSDAFTEGSEDESMEDFFSNNPMEDSSSEENSSSDDSMEDYSSDDSLEKKIQDILLAVMNDLNTMRYVNLCRQIIRTSAVMENRLNKIYTCPDLFRSAFRMEPVTYFLLIDRLKDELVFHNDSNNVQMPINLQIFIAFKRFRTYGNGSLVHKIANWAGIGHGTVDLVRLIFFEAFI